nr:hydroxyproline O-galactosyltransferase HPGT1 [Tanacetum cinerariifolium]
MQQNKGSRNAVLRSPISALMLCTIAAMASFYVAGRLWQDAENRVYLGKELDRITGQVLLMLLDCSPYGY